MLPEPRRATADNRRQFDVVNAVVDSSGINRQHPEHNTIQTPIKPAQISRLLRRTHWSLST